ncbi:MAG: hypothetical protein KC657_07615 [Myxococcales bacterium]|nr:hypothetical protein [Myxococcales bacterium]
MQKMLLMTILAATLLIPLFSARGGTVKAAIRRSVIATTVFCVVYWLALMFVYPMLESQKAKTPAAEQH